jgi:hypothetical protein
MSSGGIGGRSIDFAHSNGIHRNFRAEQRFDLIRKGNNANAHPSAGHPDAASAGCYRNGYRLGRRTRGLLGISRDRPDAARGSARHNNNPCYQSPSAAHCDNTDPVNTDCNIGSYVASSSPVYWYDSENGELTGGWSGYIQNWYSPHCGTNWARYVDTSGVGGTVNIITCLNDEFVH